MLSWYYGTYCRGSKFLDILDMIILTQKTNNEIVQTEKFTLAIIFVEKLKNLHVLQKLLNID